MGTNDRINCLKILVIIFTVLYLVFALALLAFTLFLRYEYFSSQYLRADENLGGYYIAIYIIITGSAVALVAAIIGLIGTALLKTAVVAIFLFLVTLVFLLELAAGGYAIKYKYDITERIHDGELFKSIIQVDYGTKQSETSAIDYMQRKLHCCGGESFTDYRTSTWLRLEKEKRASDKDTEVVPSTCCKDYERNRDLFNQHPCVMFKHNHLRSVGELQEPSNQIYQQGCGEALVAWISSNYIILICLAAGYVIFQIFGIVFISMLLHFLRQKQREEDGFEMSRSFEKSSWKGGNPYL